MNKIGLRKISENNYEITPCEIQFHGFSVTLGNGIKRAFPNINSEFSSHSTKYIKHGFPNFHLEFSLHCTKYIEQFFIPEMQSIFQFDETETLFATQFIQNFNEFRAQCIYLQSSQLYRDPRGIKFDPLQHYELNNSWTNSLVPFFNKISVIGHSELSEQVLFELLTLAHNTTLIFINDLLRETNQLQSANNDITVEIRLEQLREAGLL